MNNKENLIKSNERKQYLVGVYSPPWIVKNVCDMLPEEAWNSHKTIYELGCAFEKSVNENTVAINALKDIVV